MNHRLILPTLSILLWLSACDVVEPPFYGCTDPIAENYKPEATHSDGSCTYDPSLFKGCMDPAATNYDPSAQVSGCNCRYAAVRKVLLEEYTGHTCGNCPRAAEELKRLVCQWGDRVVPIAVHAGFFALPQPGSSMYWPDYRTPEGNAYNSFFGNSAQGLPNGMVNRVSSGSYPVFHSEWATRITAILAAPPDALLAIQNTYSEGSRTVSTSIDISILSALGNAPYSIIVSLTEDSVIGWQKDYDLSHPVNGENIEGYAHMHMLRRNFNGTWGEQVGGGAAMQAGLVLNVSYSMQLEESWQDRHCNVVAYLYREDTKEVVQAEIARVRAE